MRGGRVDEEALAELDADQGAELRGRAPRSSRGTSSARASSAARVEPGLWNWLSKARIAARRTLDDGGHVHDEARCVDGSNVEK